VLQMSADVRHPDLQSMKAFAFPTWFVREAAGGFSEVVHDAQGIGAVLHQLDYQPSVDSS
jgi:hypothetical protein